MREIKFRAWNSKSKEMFTPEEMAVDQMTLLPTGQFINVHSASTLLSVIYPLDIIIPLQYTGLKDKNGKEIYCSDWIKIDGEDEIFEIEWLEDTASWVAIGRNTSKVRWFDETDRGREFQFASKDTVIIGNKYEN